MAVYYVGAGGNDANNGLTWATRKLTLNGAENVPVVAGDTVYIAPGVYREMLTCDVSGGAGTPITYIGDVSGENTDGVGGVVRVTGSDNDQTVARANCVTSAAARNYRTFRGFSFDMTSGITIQNAGATDFTIEDCIIQSSAQYPIQGSGATQARWTIRRCVIMTFLTGQGGIMFSHTLPVDNCGHLVEDCVIFGRNGYGAVEFIRIGGNTVRNNTILFATTGVLVTTALTAGQSITANNNILCGLNTGFTATAVGEIVEDYNSFWAVSTARQNTNVGAHSVTYPPLFDLGIFYSGASQISGFRFPPPLFGALSQWSQVRAIADTGAATEDLLGLPRPVTAGKRSWGAVQYVDMARDTATVHAGTASKKLADAGRDQIYVPAVTVSTVFSVYVYREANYAGVNPQMIIKQPGQADTVVTDAGAAGAWNQLTTTLTPAALPGYVMVELVSNNTAAAGNYATYFDDLTVV